MALEVVEDDVDGLARVLGRSPVRTPLMEGSDELFEARLDVPELGRGDLSPALRWASSEPLPEGELASGSYRFYSAQLGLEFGSPDRFVFHVRAGFSRVEAALEVQPQQIGTGTTTARLEPGEMAVNLTMPSLQAGFTLYLFD